MGPCTASSCCCQVQSVSWVPVRPPIAAVSIATLCHVPLFRSPHTAGGFHFCHRGCCMASHCCCLHRHTVAPHSGFGPVTAQMSEVCGDSKIDGTHAACPITDCQYYSLFPSRLQGHLN
ncbi:unnamed protein product [Staurois parvus]|uniref:Secreted protein n=1 Tax=Staurois parvus TaxID=386267 RepID=A0ABN9C8N7_9NEOB|nr:unnamed protein product [Staurois parvus]